MRWVVALSLLVALAVPPRSSLAQEPPARTQEDPAQAAQHFRAAQRAFARSEYLEALRLFRAAYDAAPHPTVRFHIAMCLERLGRLRDAWTELTEVAATAALTDAQRRDAARQVVRVRAMLVTLRVEGEPAGASVRLDGVPVCALPCELPVDPGDHEVAIEAARGRATSRVSAVRGSDVVVRLAIEPEPTPSATVETGPEEPLAPVDLGAPPEVSRGRGVGWLLVTGSAIATLGAAGVIGFGLHATEIHDAWLAEPTRERLDEGVLFRDLTNASIAVLAVGGVMVLIDVVLSLAGEGTGESAAIDGIVRF